MTALPDNVRCTFVKRNGNRCGQPRLVDEASNGEDSTWCEFHMRWVKGNLPALRVEPGAEMRVSPMAALLEEIERSQVMVRWYESILADKSPEELMWVSIRESRQGGPGGDYDLTRQEQRAHPALVLLKDERSHLANVTRLAIQSGIEARQLELNEQMANTIITAMQGFARLVGRDPTEAIVKEWMAQALRAAREGRVIDAESIAEAAGPPQLPA